MATKLEEKLAFSFSVIVRSYVFLSGKEKNTHEAAGCDYPPSSALGRKTMRKTYLGRGFVVISSATHDATSNDPFCRRRKAIFLANVCAKLSS